MSLQHIALPLAAINLLETQLPPGMFEENADRILRAVEEKYRPFVMRTYYQSDHTALIQKYSKPASMLQQLADEFNEDFYEGVIDDDEARENFISMVRMFDPDAFTATTKNFESYATTIPEEDLEEFIEDEWEDVDDLVTYFDNLSQEEKTEFLNNMIEEVGEPYPTLESYTEYSERVFSSQKFRMERDADS